MNQKLSLQKLVKIRIRVSEFVLSECLASNLLMGSVIISVNKGKHVVFFLFLNMISLFHPGIRQSPEGRFLNLFDNFSPFWDAPWTLVKKPTYLDSSRFLYILRQNENAKNINIRKRRIDKDEIIAINARVEIKTPSSSIW